MSTPEANTFSLSLFQARTVVLATYILCGFGSIPALGINIGALTSVAPERRATFAKLAWRAMVNGNIACFMTACIAGRSGFEFRLDIYLGQSYIH